MEKENIIVGVDIILIAVFIFVTLISLGSGDIWGAVGFFILTMILTVLLLYQFHSSDKTGG